jgi:hypothetical protein
MGVKGRRCGSGSRHRRTRDIVGGPGASLAARQKRRAQSDTIKTWKGRLSETWTYLEDSKFPAWQLAALKAYHDRLTDQQRKAVSEAMEQGAYVTQQKVAEKLYRHARRALILVLMAKANTGTPANDLARARQALSANMTDDQALQRLKLELGDLQQALTAMYTRGLADMDWGGWDGEMHRPLLAGCAIGRRGANGPGTLGCFVTRGNDVFILSNRHVLRQAAVNNDDDAIQPAHQLGGSYHDVVATVVDVDADHDAAIAQVKRGITCRNVTPEGTQITGSAVAGLGDPVTKRGCATRLRHGNVAHSNAEDVNSPQQPPPSTHRDLPGQPTAPAQDESKVTRTRATVGVAPGGERGHVSGYVPLLT